MSRAATLTALRDHIRRLEQPVRHGVLPFGAAAIDAVLPGRGLALGALHEIVGAGGDEEDGAAAAGFAAGILARLSAGFSPTSPQPSPPPGAERELIRRSNFPSPPFRGEREGPIAKRWEGEVGSATGPVLWCLRQPDLYGAGLLAHGLDPARLVLVTVRRDEDILWAMEEGLRTGAAAGLVAVVGEVGRLPMTAGRRLQLAAERSGVTALLLRRWRNAAEANAERHRPTAAVTRWRIIALSSLSPIKTHPLSPLGGEGRVRGAPEARPCLLHAPTLPSPASGGGLHQLAGEGMGGGGAGKGWSMGIGRPRWRVELLRVRGGVPGNWEVEVADATGHVRVSADLADRPAAPGRQTAGRTGAEPVLRRAG